MIEDRTRIVRGNSHWDSPSDIVGACASQYHRDLWEDQDIHVEVWIEKDALVGVVDEICRQWDVSFFSCRGYVSQSAMYRAAQRIVATDKPCIIFHFGDHDPSGIDMTRDIAERLDLLSDGADIRVERVALTMDQIDQYDPPSNPAKESDCRHASYVSEFGESSWELDALRPEILINLINEEIENVVDLTKFRACERRQERERKILQKTAKSLKKKKSTKNS